MDTALRLAEQRSWEVIRLYEVAEELKLTLAEIREHYRQKDDLAEAWFDRADRAMLIDVASPESPLLTAEDSSGRVSQRSGCSPLVLARHSELKAVDYSRILF